MVGGHKETSSAREALGFTSLRRQDGSMAENTKERISRSVWNIAITSQRRTGQQREVGQHRGDI